MTSLYAPRRMPTPYILIALFGLALMALAAASAWSHVRTAEAVQADSAIDKDAAADDDAPVSDAVILKTAA